MRVKNPIKTAHKIGGSLMMPLTGYATENVFYKVEISNKKIILSPIEV
jgi:hypothetical protein